MNRKRRKKTAIKIARSNRAAIKKIQSGIEYKVLDVDTANFNVNTTGTPQYLCTIAQGDTDIARDGNKIQVKRVYIKGTINNKHGTADDCTVRIALVRWLQGQGQTLAVGTVWNNQAGTTRIYNPMAPDHRKLFKVYYDHMFTMDTTQHSIIPFKINQRLNSNVQYNGTTGVEAQCESGGLYLFIWSDVAGTTDNPLANFVARVTYTDS